MLEVRAIKKIIMSILLILLLGAGIFYYLDRQMIGDELDSYRGVPVYYNGIAYTESYGKHYNTDGYYYGQKWQCVEFVKRFYYDAKEHKMPDVMGHAKDFFNPNVPHGEINQRRGLKQYINGGAMRPSVDDLLVFTDTKYGHVAIISKVNSNFIEVVQQNIYGKPREAYPLKQVNGNWVIGEERKPAGWLRK